MDEQTQSDTKKNDNENGRPRRGSIVGPMILIGIGIVLLLNNLGLLPWGIWGVVWRAWPVILILVGLDILIGRKSVWGTIVVLLITAAVLVAVVAVSWAPSLVPGPAARETFRQPSEEASRAEVNLGPGVARMSVTASTDASMLIEADVTRGEHERVVRNYRMSNGTAYFSLRSENRRWPSFGFGDWGGRRWNVRLGPALPISLSLDSGVSQTDVDLRGLTISRLDVKTGVSRTKVRLPDTGRIDASIDGGVGNTTIVVPARMAARITADSGVGSLNVPSSYRKEGGTYVSGSAETTSTLDLDVELGVGSVTIEEAP